MLVALVVDSWTGYPILAKEANFFDEHPNGEGHDRFRIVLLERLDLEMHEWFEWVPHPEGHGRTTRQPIVKFNTNVLRASGFEVASNLNNKVSRAALQKVILTDYLADYQIEHDKYDTRRNAVLTVGTAGTHASWSVAFIASSGGDHIKVGSTAAGFYLESPLFPHSLNVSGDIADQGVIVQNSTGSGIQLATGGSTITNIHSRGVGGVPTFGFIATGPGNIVHACKASAVLQGYRSDAGPAFYNDLAFDCDSGVWTSSSTPTFWFMTCVDNTTAGFKLAGSTATIGCLGIANGTDYTLGCGGANSANNASSDGTQPGTGGVGTATTSWFTNYAADDFSLDIANAGTFFGAPAAEADITLSALRKRAGVSFFGAYDPDLDPGTMPTTKVSSVSVLPLSTSGEIDFTTPSGTVNKVGIAIDTTAAGAVANAVAETFAGTISGLTSSTAFEDYNVNTTDGKTDLSASTEYFVVLVVGDNNGFATNAVLGDETSFTTLAAVVTSFKVPIDMLVKQTNKVELTVKV